ncbi:MAG: O-antigen ligase family protein [Oscillospiraceae bacterium]
MAKTPKTIFGTTEKSNFILNMKSETLQKWIGVMLALCIIIPQIGNFVISAAKASSAFLGAFLYLTGFSCILFFIIAMLKKEQSFKENKSYFAVIFMAVWAFASYYGVVIRTASDDRLDTESVSEFVSTALEGELGRYEGLLALFAYFGIFLLTTTLTKEKTVRLLMDIIVGTGIVQAVIAVLQHIPNFDFLTDYADLPTAALRDVMLSSGLSDSPILYGSFLTIVTGIALTGAVFEENVTRARVYGASAVLFWLTGLFTSSIVPIIGIGCVFVFVTAVVIINKKKGGTAFESGKLRTPMKRYAVLMAAMAVVLALVLIFQGIYIRDKEIAYYDAFYRLFIVLSFSPMNTQSLYEIGFERSMYFIKAHPILGIGPDCFAKYQLLDEELVTCSIDRSYNEYLYTAATRGIPALIGYLVFLGIVIKNCVSGMKLFLADSKKWYYAAVFGAIAAYIVQAFFSASSVTVAPLFWLICGIACAKKLRASE